MKKESRKTIILCGLIVIAATILFYMLSYNNIFDYAIKWVSLLFLIAVEIASIVKALKFCRSILGATVVVLDVIHICVVFILSIAFINLWPDLIIQYVLINLLLIAAIAVIDILLSHFMNKADQSNLKYAESSSIMEDCLADAEKLLIEEGESQYTAALKEIVEMLRYSNKSYVSGLEDDISAKIKELQSVKKTDADGDFGSKIEELHNMIKSRSVQTKKSGKF